MITPGGVQSLVRSFGDATDGQALKSQELTLLLLECSLAPFSRSQFLPGHITCTGLVLAPDGRKLLLVHHKRLDRWLLPGGHVEPDDPEIWDAARRRSSKRPGPNYCRTQRHGSLDWMFMEYPRSALSHIICTTI